MEGTLQASGRGLRANVRLIRAADGRAQWGGTIESDGQHLLTLEESIAAEIALNVHVPLTDRERRTLEARRRVNPDAHELYVRGRFEWGKRTGDGSERAAECFRRAIDLDPTYARAYAGLADCYLLLGGYSFSPQLEAVPKAKALALRALELDPSLGEAHATLGLSAQNLEWDWESVEQHYRQAIALAPNHATGHHWYAEFLSILGRFDQSRHAFAEARRVDPISPIIQVDEAQLYFFERHTTVAAARFSSSPNVPTQASSWCTIGLRSSRSWRADRTRPGSGSSASSRVVTPPATATASGPPISRPVTPRPRARRSCGPSGRRSGAAFLRSC